MPPDSHLLIPFAASNSEGCRTATSTLALPNLERLLARMEAVATDTADENTFSAPHERALARAVGLPPTDGRIPWAAWKRHCKGAAEADQAHAFITPCHWQIGMDRATMVDPAALALSDQESRALVAAMQPYFAEDGIALEFDSPGRWIARGEIFGDLRAASLDRVVGRNLNDWLSDSDAGRPLRRLQSEMQMLLYTHPVNDEREQRRQLPVNSFWVSGAGALRADAAVSCDAPTMPLALRDPALREDWAAWAEAWRVIDATECATLAGRLARSSDVRLTLCGERSAVVYEPAPRTLARRLSGVFNRISVAQILQRL